MRRSAAIFAATLAGAVLIALAAGMAIIGSPAEIRERRLDAQKLSDLRRIATAVDTRLRKTGTLPATLEALQTADQPVSLRLRAPGTAEPYDYIPTGPRSYRLCATFGHPHPDGARTPEFWRHGAGRHCFAIDSLESKAK